MKLTIKYKRGSPNVLRLRVSRCGVRRLRSDQTVSVAERFEAARSVAETQVLVELAPCG